MLPLSNLMSDERSKLRSEKLTFGKIGVELKSNQVSLTEINSVHFAAAAYLSTLNSNPKSHPSPYFIPHQSNCNSNCK